MAAETDATLELEHILFDGDVSPEQAEHLSHLLSEAPLKDVIALLERSEPVRAALVLRLLPRADSIAAFDALDAAHQADLVEALARDQVADFFGELDPDDRVALFDELPAEIANRLLHSLPKDERDVTGIVLGYPKRSVGRRMSPEMPYVFNNATAGHAIEALREMAEDVETIYTVPIIGEDRRLLGVTSLRRLLIAEPDTPVTEFMDDPIYATAHADAEETARWFQALDMLALPIVDESNRLVGILTMDDVFDILEDADNEDTARAGASEPLQQPYLTTPVWKLVRSRIVWLAVLAISALLTVSVLDAFEEALAAAVVLSLFIPLLTGTGGNTGNQAATTVTRSLALGDVRKRDAMKVLWRELRVGFFLGLMLGLVFGGFLGIFYGPQIGFVLGITLVAVCTLAASVGGVMPIIAKAIGADPAVFSNPFISTFVDATGLVIYFLIARAILGI